MSEMQQNDRDENMPEDNVKEDALEEGVIDSCPAPETVQETPQRKPIRVSLFTFVLTTVALVLAAVMITYTVCSAFYKERLADQAVSTVGSNGYPFALFSAFINEYSFEDADEEKMMAAALKAYVAATGDRYAYYYTSEEYSDFKQDQTGESQGIGITVISAIASIDGENIEVLAIESVVSGSPAFEAGLMAGDLVYSVKTEGVFKTVAELGASNAVEALRGKSGESAEFTVKRAKGESFETIDFSVLRKDYVALSVVGSKHPDDSSVGVITVQQFDMTTPTQFKSTVDALIAKGCTRFVFDVRNNPGGDLNSIIAVLSLFLSEGDTVIRTEYSDGTLNVDKVMPVIYSGAYAGCSVSVDDIGKYADLNSVVLCNKRTASAAELFTASFIDYELGTVVGTITYGKGTMQRTIPLEPYGYKGALKLTVAKYYSAKGGGVEGGYDGVGITPHVVVNNDGGEDLQLKEALKCFK